MRIEKGPGRTGVVEGSAALRWQPLHICPSFRFHLKAPQLPHPGPVSAWKPPLNLATDKPDGMTVSAEEGTEPGQGQRCKEG